MAYPNIHAGEKQGNYTTGTKRITAAQLHNRSNTGKYPLNDYSADKRFYKSGAFGINKPKTSSSFRVPMGGFGGGGRGGATFAEEDLKRQLKYDKAIWERSTPDVTGVGGQVRWDREKNMLTTSLSPENQAIYDSMIGRQKMFAGNVDNLAGGGWEDAYQQQFDSMRNMYSASDAREEAIRKERQNATNASSTGIFQEDANAASLRNQRDLELQNTAFLQSQQLIDSELGREYGAVGMMSNLGGIANSMAVMPTPNTAGNMQNVSTASTRWADNLAMESAKRAKGKSDFWGSILGSLFK